MPLAAWRYQNPFVYKHQETSQNFFGEKRAQNYILETCTYLFVLYSFHFHSYPSGLLHSVKKNRIFSCFRGRTSTGIGFFGLPWSSTVLLKTFYVKEFEGNETPEFSVFQTFLASLNFIPSKYVVYLQPVHLDKCNCWNKLRQSFAN